MITRPLIFGMPGNAALTGQLVDTLAAERGEMIMRHFPDGESYVRILSKVERRDAIVVCTLHQPDDKLLPLYFLCRALKDLEAGTVRLVAPYLAYMRQDKVFHAGEAVTSSYFARLLSSFCDGLFTIDPHLHRRGSMADIYTVPCTVLHAAPFISEWIKQHVKDAVLIGPDGESEQWVSAVAHDAGMPFTVLEKTRMGDTDVRVSVPHVKHHADRTPVLVDDIISTARTMIAAVGHLKAQSMKSPVCIGVHGVFAGTAYDDLLSAGAVRVITSDTIPHPSNTIGIAPLLARAVHEAIAG